MSSTVWSDAYIAMLFNLDSDALHSAFATLTKYKLDEAKEKEALLIGKALNRPIC